MKRESNSMSRRHFLALSGAMAGTSLINPSAPVYASTAETHQPAKKARIAMVGTGIRGTGMWGKSVVQDYPNYVEFVGLCDINPGRVALAKETMGVSCPTFTDFEKMMKETKPELLIVTTVDNTHDQFIIRGMELGADIIEQAK